MGDLRIPDKALGEAFHTALELRVCSVQGKASSWTRVEGPLQEAVFWPVNQTVRACAGFVVHWAVWEILHGTRGSAAHQALEEVRRDPR